MRSKFCDTVLLLDQTWKVPCWKRNRILVCGRQRHQREAFSNFPCAWSGDIWYQSAFSSRDSEWLSHVLMCTVYVWYFCIWCVYLTYFYWCVLYFNACTHFIYCFCSIVNCMESSFWNLDMSLWGMLLWGQCLNDNYIMNHMQQKNRETMMNLSLIHIWRCRRRLRCRSRWSPHH